MGKSARKRGLATKVPQVATTLSADATMDKGMIMPQIPAGTILPIFEGSSNPWLWVRKCETFFSLYHIPVSKKRVSFASLYLRGKAETWYNCTIRGRKEDIWWEDFAEEICDRFGVVENLDLLKRFKDLRQYSGGGLSVSKYHNKFEELLSLVMSMYPWYDRDQIVSMYIAGLTKAIRIEVQKHNPTTVTRAFELAKLYESHDREEDYAAAADSATDMEETDGGETIARISPQALGMKKEIDENGNPVVYVSSLKPSKEWNTITGDGVTLPCKRPMKIMYDSWSHHSFIDPKLAEECGFIVRKADDPVTVIANCGKTRIVSDHVCNGFTWSMNGETCVLNMRILKLEDGGDMILGTDAAYDIPLIIDFGGNNKDGPCGRVYPDSSYPRELVKDGWCLCGVKVGGKSSRGLPHVCPLLSP